MKHAIAIGSVVLILIPSTAALAEGEWEMTPQSQQALQRGLEWLDKNKGSEGNRS